MADKRLPKERGFGVFYLLECQRGFIAILVPEIVVHAKVCLSAQLVT